MIIVGLLGGLIGLCGMELYYVPPSAWATLGILLVSGLVMALLNLYFQVQSGRLGDKTLDRVPGPPWVYYSCLA